MSKKLAWLLVLVAAPCVAERRLEDVLGALAASQSINFVLPAALDLDQTVPDSVSSVDQLRSWLPAVGIEVSTLANGDLQLVPAQRGQVTLRALPVTATATADNTPAIASSTTALTADRLTQLNARQLDQLFVRAANVFGSAEEFYVRGVPSRGDLNTLGNAAAQWGAVPLPDLLLGRLPLTTWDLASAGFERGARSGEIDGPFSAYAGRIALRPGTPEFDALQQFRLSADHRGGRQAAALVNRQPIDQELALRASLDYQKTPGLLHRENAGGAFDQATARTGRIALLWEPAALPATQWSLDLGLVDGNSGPQRLATSGDPFDRVGQTEPFDRRDLRAWLGSATVRLETASAGTWQATAMATDGRSSAQPNRPLSNTFDPPYRLVDLEKTQLQSLQTGWELQSDRWLVGASASVGRQRRQEQLDRDQRLWHLDNRLLRASLSLHGSVVLASNWTLQGRLRRTRDRLYRHCTSTAGSQAAADCLESVGLLLIPASGQFAPFADHYSEWSPQLALEYRAGDRSRVSLRALRGFNAGGAFSSADFSGNPFWIFYQPEQVRTGELRWQFHTSTTQLATTVFYSSLRDQWTAEQGGAFIDAVSNSGRSSSYGLELEASVSLAPTHRLEASAGWLHTRYRRYTPFERDALFEPVAGNAFAGAPGYSGSLTWRFDLAPQWQLNLAASYHGRVQANANNAPLAQIPGVVLVESRLAWRRGDWTVAGNVFNLLDREYHQTTPNISRRTQRVDYLPGLPRTLGLTVELAF